LFIGFFSAVIAITLQHNVQLPQVLMGRFRHASRAAMKMCAAFKQRRGHSSTRGAQDRQARFGAAHPHGGQQEGPPLTGARTSSGWKDVAANYDSVPVSSRTSDSAQPCQLKQLVTHVTRPLIDGATHADQRRRKL
jgi:hypothetical protein